MSESNTIIGDCSIATNLSTNLSKYLLNILSSSKLKLHNTYPVHKHGNSLDILISHKSSNLFSSYSLALVFMIITIYLLPYNPLNCRTHYHSFFPQNKNHQHSRFHQRLPIIFHITNPNNYLPLFKPLLTPTHQSLLKFHS